MKSNLWTILLGASVASVFVLVLILFTLREGEAAVVTTFGKPERALVEPGLYMRWPWPVQKVHRLDHRVHTLEGTFEQTLTGDGKTIIVTAYAGWRIADPVLFLERVGSAAEAERNLNGLISNYKNAVFGRYPFSALVNTDPDALRFERIEAEILAAVAPEARARYGIETSFLGIQRLALPEAITEKVFERMRAERENIAERARAEGEGEAIRIRAEADSEREKILAGAEARAKRIRAEGDAEAARFYRVFEENPELAIFLRKLEVLEESLRERSTVILGPDTEPFDLLEGDQALPAAARESAR
jgi:modulator of FtsH protease HflC